MKKIRNIVGIVALALSIVACSGNKDVDDVKPWTEEYELPQGKSDVDDRIVEYYNRFGTYILYEYTSLDFRYEFENSYVYELPDPAHVGGTLDMLEDIWFDFYPDSFHKKYMPLKIMLADHITPAGYPDILYSSILRTSNSVGIGFCSEALQEIDGATKLEYKNTLQQQLWSVWVNFQDVPGDFFDVSDYSRVADADASSDNYARERGFIARYSSGTPSEWSTTLSASGELDKQVDLSTFIEGMIARTSADWAADLEYPLVKQKYDILRAWIQEKYGVDLQTVGDATYE